MARKTAPETPRDNASLAGLFGLDFFPSEGAAIGGSEDIFRTAARIIEQSGIEARLHEWRTHDRRGLSRPGPSPWMSETQVLTLMLVLSLSRRPALFTEMQELLRHAPAECLSIIGIEIPEEITSTALYHRAYNSFRRLVRLMDPEPGSLYRLLTREELAERLAQRDDTECALRRERAHEFTNAVLRGTWMLLPRKVRREARGDIAVDATIIKAPSRGRGQRSLYASSDPEAGWYRRDGNHDGGTSRAATKYQRRSDTLIWGREVYTAVSYGAGQPSIVLGASFDVPGRRLARNALRAVDAATKIAKPGHFVSDRAYLPGTKPEDLALPLRARGFALVFDYDRSERGLGQQESHGGAILVEGQWYCPSMPTPLLNASIDYYLRKISDPHRIDAKVYEERLAQRQRYALRPKERADAQGYSRLACPAVGKFATVSCPRRESAPEVSNKPRALVLTPMLVNPVPKVCEQKTLTFPPSGAAKFEQTYPYRSAEWTQHFSTGRQSVESVNKSLKDGRFAPVDDPEMRPRRGFIAQLFSLTVMMAATNTRKIIAWLHEQIGVTSISSVPVRRERHRERTRGWTSEEANAPPLGADA